MIIGASSFASPLPELEKEVDSIELYIPKLKLHDGHTLMRERVEQMRDLLSTSCIRTTLHAPYYGDSPTYPRELMVDTANMGKSQFRLMEESIVLANDLGCSVVVVHPGRITGNREECFSHMVRNLKKLALIAEDCGIIIGLENKEGTDQANLCCRVKEHLRAIEEVNSPCLNATFDIGHANLTCGGDRKELRDFAKELKDTVVHVHVHDNRGRNGDRYFGDLHDAPGDGTIDFSVLKELAFDGVYNLEVFSMDGVRAGKRMLQELNGNVNER